jgi:hypothetical protein
MTSTNDRSSLAAAIAANAVPFDGTLAAIAFHDLCRFIRENAMPAAFVKPASALVPRQSFVPTVALGVR